MGLSTCLLLVCTLLSTCSDNSTETAVRDTGDITVGEGDADTDADMDADSDADADSDSDTDTDGDTDTDMDSDTDSDTDVDTDTDTVSNTLTDTDSNSAGDRGSDTLTHIEAVSDTDTDTNRDTGIHTEDTTDSDTETIHPLRPWNVLVENEGLDCEMTGELAEVDNPLLPDPFLKLDHTRIARKDEWRCRRQEILRQVETFIEGEKPPRPEVVEGEVSEDAISVYVMDKGKSIEFSADVHMPPNTSVRPVPAIVSLGDYLIVPDEELLHEEEVAIIVIDPIELASDNIRSVGKFFEIYEDSGASALIAWGWGVSRIIDVLEVEKAAGRNLLINPAAVGVIGCSRLGKGAFIAGAFDQRIALTIPRESGTAGVSAWRVVVDDITGYVGAGRPAHSPMSAWTEAKGWMGAVFEPYLKNVNALPVDTHSIVAMIAPRGLFIPDNPYIRELCPRCQHVAVLAGREVYKALGVENNITYDSAISVDESAHCHDQPEGHAEIMRRVIRAFLTQTETPQGEINTATWEPEANGDLTAWVDWQTPTLK